MGRIVRTSGLIHAGVLVSIPNAWSATVGSAPRISQATKADVNSGTRACPSPGTVGVTAASVAAASVPGSARQGSAVISRLSGAGSPTVGPTVGTVSTPNVLSLSRVLGGSLKGHETAHLIADVELDRLVRDLLRSVPAPVQ